MSDAPKAAYLDPERVSFLDEVTETLKSTPRESWWEGPTYRSPEGRHCCLSWIADRMGMDAMNRFESEWSTSYVIGDAVNDKASQRYPQDHPKDRVLAFLADLRYGAQEDTETSMWREWAAGEERKAHVGQ